MNRARIDSHRSYEVYGYSRIVEDPLAAAGQFRVAARWRRDAFVPTSSPADLVSVQVAWFSGWKAWVGARRIPISADGMVFQVLHPACQGPSEITLRWAGRPDRIPSAIVSLVALAFLAMLLCSGDNSVRFEWVFSSLRSSRGPVVDSNAND